MKRALTVIAVVALLVAVAGITRPLVMWDGRVIRRIKIQIKGADGRPLRGASVMLIQGLAGLTEQRTKEEVFEDQLKHGRDPLISDGNGRVDLSGQFGAGGGSGPHGRTGHFVVTGDILVNHNDYLDFSAPLADLIGERRVPLEKKELTFTVFLKPKNGTKPHVVVPNGS